MKMKPMMANRIHWIAYDRCGPGSSVGGSSALGRVRGAGSSDTMIP